MSPKFSLQPVLDYRHTRVELLEVELGNLMQSQKRGIAFLDVLKNSQGRIYTQLNESQHGDLDLFMLSRLRSSLKVVNDRIQEQQERLRELAHQVDLKRGEVIHAKQDEEVLRTLKNKEAEVYRQEQAQQENRLQDDIYINRAYRRAGAA
ncbi:MAG: flagellar FliJ family protein [Chloroflexi bacterium]|nr:flagellar FliJ family protein [Chloroflexota bacterium]